MQENITIPTELLFKSVVKDLSLVSLYAYFDLTGVYDFREASKVTGIPVSKIGSLTAVLVNKGYVKKNDLAKTVETTCENNEIWHELLSGQFKESNIRKENKEVVKKMRVKK